ncbi:MAG: hotdog fold thioesterase [Chloroflexota bacterium]
MTDNERQKITNYILNDPWGNYLGAELEELRYGYARFSLKVKPEFMNFNGLAHGGLIFSLGDLAFAAAGNSRGQMAVALEVKVNFVRAGKLGDLLVAEAEEVSLNGPIGLFEIRVKDGKSNELIAQSQATLYRKKQLFAEDE